MATSNLLATQFDDSDDDDDNFNPAPADMSDDDNAGEDDGQPEAQARSGNARRRVMEDTYDNSDEEAPPVRTSGRSKTPEEGDVAADEDGEDDGGEGEDLNGEAADEEDEDEGDEDEEEVTVRSTLEAFFMQYHGSLVFTYYDY